MSDYRLSDALDEIEDIAFKLGNNGAELVGREVSKLRARILDIRVGIFNALLEQEHRHQIAAGITHPLVDENAINPIIRVPVMQAPKNTGDWL